MQEETEEHAEAVAEDGAEADDEAELTDVRREGDGEEERAEPGEGAPLQSGDGGGDTQEHSDETSENHEEDQNKDDDTASATAQNEENEEKEESSPEKDDQNGTAEAEDTQQPAEAAPEHSDPVVVKPMATLEGRNQLCLTVSGYWIIQSPLQTRACRQLGWGPSCRCGRGLG